MENQLIHTHIPELDKALGDLKPGRMYLFGAQPGSGLSSLLITSSLEQAKRHPVGVWSGDISKSRISDRYKINSVNKSTYPFQNIYLFCQPTTIDELIEKIRHWVLVYKVKVVWLDYVNLISVSADMFSKYSNQQQMNMIVNQLQEVCTELQIPIILFVQLARTTIQRMPDMSDIPYTGRMEELSHAVTLVSKPSQNIMDMHVLKNADNANKVRFLLKCKPQNFNIEY